MVESANVIASRIIVFTLSTSTIDLRASFACIPSIQRMASYVTLFGRSVLRTVGWEGDCGFGVALAVAFFAFVGLGKIAGGCFCLILGKGLGRGLGRGSGRGAGMDSGG